MAVSGCFLADRRRVRRAARGAARRRGLRGGRARRGGAVEVRAGSRGGGMLLQSTETMRESRGDVAESPATKLA